MFTEVQKIGILLTLGGLLFTVIGVFLLLDRTMLGFGNVLFLSGMVLLIGFPKTVRFFAARSKVRGSVLFFGGLALVFWGWTFVGFFVELFGFLNLFGDFFPLAIRALRTMPIVGHFLELPIVAKVINMLGAGKTLPI